MTWNYRVLRYADGEFGIHEVYYDETGKPTSCTLDAVGVVGEDVAGVLEMMTRALKEPVLEWELFDR